MKFYQQLTAEQKRTIRHNIEEVSKLRKQQIQLFDVSLMQPMRDCIRAGEEVKKNTMSIEQYVKINEAAKRQLEEFFVTGNPPKKKVLK